MKISSKRLNRISPILEHEIQNGNIPGAVVAVGIGMETLYFESRGYAENQNGIVREMTKDTIFDLASLTKVTATLPAILTLVDNGDVRLNDDSSLFIPELSQTTKGAITVGHLLTHSAGLAPFRLYHKIYKKPEEIIFALHHEGMTATPGIRTEYSDIGFMLLGRIIEIVTGKTLDEYCKQHVFSPLNMSETMFCPPSSLFPRIASTEFSKIGVVHDENAEALGGVAGHAGLFAPMSDLISYVSMWLGHQSLLSDAIRKIAVLNQTPHLNGNRGYGWVCRNDAYDHTGDMWPETTVGHTGFTGTSLAFDPTSKLWMIILTNAVHYGREKKAMIRLRGRLHNVVASSYVLE